MNHFPVITQNIYDLNLYYQTETVEDGMKTVNKKLHSVKRYSSGLVKFSKAEVKCCFGQTVPYVVEINCTVLSTYLLVLSAKVH